MQNPIPKLRQRSIIYEKPGYFSGKSHTCEVGGAHPRNSVRHLLMNLKNNYLSKKLLKWANKKCKYFNIYIKKYKKKQNQRKTSSDIIFYTCVPKLFMI